MDCRFSDIVILWHAILRHGWLRRGQASVEFALVLVAFLALVIALGALSNFMQSGALTAHAAAGASHAVGGPDTGAWADVLAY